MRKTFTSLAVICGVFMTTIAPISAAEDSGCFPVTTLKDSFKVVFPNAKQVTMEGGAAEAYLAEYNSFGRPTTFAADELFMNILPNGITMLIPLNDGIGCQRLIAGPELHKEIMIKVARGAI